VAVNNSIKVVPLVYLL